MEPVLIRADVRKPFMAILGLALLTVVILALGFVVIGVVAAVGLAIAAFMIGRRAVVVADNGVTVRTAVGRQRYRWSNIAGAEVAQRPVGGSTTATARLTLVDGNQVWLAPWTEPDPTVVRRVDQEARNRQRGG